MASVSMKRCYPSQSYYEVIDLDTTLHTPDGVRDIYGRECAEKHEIETRILRQFRLFGYELIETPEFEFFDVFHRASPGISSREMFKFFDRDNDTLALRPDITPAIARCVAKYFPDTEAPLRFCYLGEVFRNHLNYKGSLGEMTQSGVELVGDSTVDADAETVALAIESLKSAGLREFQVEIGQAEFYRGLVEEAGLSREEERTLRSLIENKNSFGVEEFAEQVIRDPDIRGAIFRLPELFGSISEISAARSLTTSARALKAIRRLEKINEILEDYGLTEYVSYDLGMLSEQEYYTGMIFKAFSYGTGDYLVNGGRYDRLLTQFGRDLPAVGFAITVNRLQAALRSQRIEIPLDPPEALVVYEKAATADAVRELREIRAAGKRAVGELYREKRGMDYYRREACALCARRLVLYRGGRQEETVSAEGNREAEV